MARSLPGYDERYGDRRGAGYDAPDANRPPDGAFGAPPLPLAATEGVLSRRVVAWLFDIVFVFLFSCALALAIFVIGLLTFTLGWALFAVLPASGVLYSAITVGGRRQATWGMRVMGLRVVEAGGGRVDWITAAVHALLFYLAAATFLVWVLDALVGLVRADRRLAHDLVVGLAVVRAS